MKKLLATLFTLTLFISCTGSDKDINTAPPKDYSAENDKEITDYLAKNNLTATKSEHRFILHHYRTRNWKTAYSDIFSNCCLQRIFNKRKSI
ncbi:hypothetical protein ACQ9BO_23465 [Flavobacterium sp. P21]|uniref:hypothetical protein n=1 Tax=Flavobacterium sp. P21 TaxID=3423948 RepID=UPI003D67270A